MVGIDYNEDIMRYEMNATAARRRNRMVEPPDPNTVCPTKNFPFEFNKYKDKAIRFIDKFDHYELIFMDAFTTPSSGANQMDPMYTLITDIVLDMKDADKSKEIHVFVGSYGGEVHALNMIMEQLMQFKYRVGINLGYACSCGWMLLFACQERYVSKYSTNMFHSMSSVSYGKIFEAASMNKFNMSWWNELIKLTDTEKVLTKEEFELAKTSEVTLTGAELIERGAAKDYSEYASRVIPFPVKAYRLNNNFILLETVEGKFFPFVSIKTNKDDLEVPYEQVLKHVNNKVDKDNATNLDKFIMACGNGFAVEIDLDDEKGGKKKSEKKSDKKGKKTGGKLNGKKEKDAVKNEKPAKKTEKPPKKKSKK